MVMSSTASGDRGNQHTGGKVSADTLATAEERAAQAGVSIATQKRADKVAKADPELVRDVAHGKISLPKAVEQVSPKKPAPVVSAPEPHAEATNDHNTGDFSASRIRKNLLFGQSPNFGFFRTYFSPNRSLINAKGGIECFGARPCRLCPGLRHQRRPRVDEICGGSIFALQLAKITRQTAKNRRKHP